MLTSCLRFSTASLVGFLCCAAAMNEFVKKEIPAQMYCCLIKCEDLPASFILLLILWPPCVMLVQLAVLFTVQSVWFSSLPLVINSICHKTVRERCQWGSHKCPRLMDYKWTSFCPSHLIVNETLFLPFSPSLSHVVCTPVPRSFPAALNWILNLVPRSVFCLLMAGCFRTHCIRKDHGFCVDAKLLLVGRLSPPLAAVLFSLSPPRSQHNTFSHGYNDCWM